MKPKHVKAFMKTAGAFAECSSGTRLKVGAAVVKDSRIISVGYNALPKHLDGPLEDENNQTLSAVRHAEKSALMGLLRAGISPVGATMFCTHACCYLCAVDIVDAGIVEFIYQHDYRSQEGLQHLKSCGIVVQQFKEKETQ